MAVYLDCNATAPIEPRVQEEVVRFMTEEFGNAGSRTHDFGRRANSAVQRARDQLAAVVDASRDEVIFTSGATESDNLAILGLAQHGKKTSKKHIITTAIEHKAVLEPMQFLVSEGFEVDLITPTLGGWVQAEDVARKVRHDTLLVSVMQANNETGVLQPLPEICKLLEAHDCYLHVDAAQGFGKEIDALRNKRLDLISLSGHKIYGPKGVGALITRRRGYERPPLMPLQYGGGQERGLRPGTLPVALIVGLGLASELALREFSKRAERCKKFRESALRALAPVDPMFNGDVSRTLPHVLNLSFAGLDSEAVMLALKDIVAISNGSACTSQSYAPSHVLRAMGLPNAVVEGALRISWCHMTPDVDWEEVASTIRKLQ